MSIRAAWVLRLAIGLGTVVALALAVRYTFVTLGDSRADHESTFMVRAQAKDAGQPDSGQPELRIEHLIIDGQRVRFESLDARDDWELIVRSGTGSQLVQQRFSDPAKLSFRGKSFLMFVKASGWSGTLEVERDGLPVQAWELDARDGQERGLVIEDPPAPVSATTFVLALLLGGAVAVGLGALRAGRSGLPWLICFLVALHTLFWLSHSTGVTNDSVGYLDQVMTLRDGVPGYFPPGYPMLLGVADSFAGRNLGRWVALLQHALAVTTGVWSYLLLRRIVAEEPALLAGILSGGLAPIVTSSQAVMSEIPTAFAIVGALYFAVRAAETGRRHFAILSGLLTGYAGILRIAPLAGLLPAVGLVHLLPGTKRGLRIAGVTLAVTAAVVLVPVSWFWYGSGQPKLADSAGLHLYNRMVVEQQQLDESAPSTRRLLALLKGADPRTMAWWEVQVHPGLAEVEGDSQAVDLIRAVALESLRKDPWAYLKLTPGLAWREYLADPNGGIPRWGEMTETSARMENPPLLRLTAAGLHWRWAMEQFDHLLWPILCWSAIAGTIVGLWSPQRKLVLALAWVAASYLLVTASLDSFASRYNVPIGPIVVALATVPLGLLLPAAARPHVDAPQSRELAA